MAVALFRRGDVVEIVTLGRGRGGHAYNTSRKMPVERWLAVVLMPSPVSSGWWIVKKLDDNRPTGRPYTVPETEMASASREVSPLPQQARLRRNR